MELLPHDLSAIQAEYHHKSRHENDLRQYQENGGHRERGNHHHQRYDQEWTETERDEPCHQGNDPRTSERQIDGIDEHHQHVREKTLAETPGGRNQDVKHGRPGKGPPYDSIVYSESTIFPIKYHTSDAVVFYDLSCIFYGDHGMRRFAPRGPAGGTSHTLHTNKI